MTIEYNNETVIVTECPFCGESMSKKKFANHLSRECDGKPESSSEETEDEIDQMSVLAEAEMSDPEIYCPGCGNLHVQLSLERQSRLRNFEAICGNCGGYLSIHTSVAVDPKYEGDMGVSVLKELVTDYWDTRIEEGITRKQAVDLKDGKPVYNEIDVTGVFAEECQKYAQSFGWDWKRPDERETRIEKMKREKKNQRRREHGNV